MEGEEEECPFLLYAYMETEIDHDTNFAYKVWLVLVTAKF